MCVLRATKLFFLFVDSFVFADEKIRQCHVRPLVSHAWLGQSKPPSRGMGRGYGWSVYHTDGRVCGMVVNQSVRRRWSSAIPRLG